MSSIRTSTIGRSPEMPCAHSAGWPRRRRAGARPTAAAASDRRRARGWRGAGTGCASSGVDAEMVQLHLRLGPGQRRRALEGVGVVVLVDQVEQRSRATARPASRTRCAPCRRPESARGGAGEDRIEHGADGVGQRPAVDHGDRRRAMSRPRPRKRARSVSYSSSPTRLALDDGEMRGPDLGLAGRRGGGASPGCAPTSATILGLHEQLGEGRMRRVGARRRQHDLGVGGQLDLARRARRIGDRDAADLGVVLRRDDDLERRRDRAVAPDELGAILGERHLVAVRLDAARLVARRPDLAALDVAQEDVACPSRRA